MLIGFASDWSQVTPDTAPQIIHRAFGRPAPEGKTGSQYRFEACEGCCATCAAPIAEGVPFEPRRGVSGINNDTFYGHAEYARWGTHVCAACAWLYGDPKRTHRGVLAAGAYGAWPTIAKPVDGRPRWRDALAEIEALPPETPMTGVLTVDPKPRLWPRAHVMTVGTPGLYAHSPDHNLSAWVSFAWPAYRAALALVDEARGIGATKTAIWHSLLVSPALSDKVGIGFVIDLDRRLDAVRGTSAFLIAVLVA